MQLGRGGVAGVAATALDAAGRWRWARAAQARRGVWGVRLALGLGFALRGLVGAVCGGDRVFSCARQGMAERAVCCTNWRKVFSAKIDAIK